MESKWFHSGGPSRNTKSIVHHIITANGRKKNFLLNVGPYKKGDIHPDSIKTLIEVGKMWIPVEKILDAEP
ncbi:MAG: alpha-L-fucosidase [Luteolibacter sp.]